MAIDNRQLCTTIKFYPSLPLYMYANGICKDIEVTNMLGMDATTGAGNLEANTLPPQSLEMVYKLFSLNPSNITTTSVEPGSIIQFKSYQKYDSNFIMVLGHNFNETSMFVDHDQGTVSAEINSMVDSLATYDGWSLYEAAVAHQDAFQIEFKSTAEVSIGSVLWGKSWQTPQHCDISQTFQISYGNKVKTTLGGKKLSTSNWNGPSRWGDLHAWELLPHNEKDATTGKQEGAGQGGLRKWQIKFSSVQHKYLMPQNNTANSYGWTQDSTTNYEVSGNDSLYNRYFGIDFNTDVYSKLMGSHLPCVVKISDSYNNDQFAIVRISDYKVIERNPKLLDFSITLEEQI